MVISSNTKVAEMAMPWKNSHDLTVCTVCLHSKKSNRRCQVCKSALRSVVGACVCGGFHPDASLGHSQDFWHRVELGQIFDFTLSPTMQSRFRLIRDNHRHWTQACIRDVLEIDMKIVRRASMLFYILKRLDAIETDPSYEAGSKADVFAEFLDVVYGITVLLIFRRFSSINTRFSRFGIVRRDGSEMLLPKMDIRKSVNLDGTIPWGESFYYERLIKYVKDKDPSRAVPSNFGEQLLEIIEEIGLDIKTGTWLNCQFRQSSVLLGHKLTEMILPQLDRHYLNENKPITILRSPDDSNSSICDSDDAKDIIDFHQKHHISQTPATQDKILSCSQERSQNQSPHSHSENQTEKAQLPAFPTTGVNSEISATERGISINAANYCTFQVHRQQRQQVPVHFQQLQMASRMMIQVPYSMNPYYSQIAYPIQESMHHLHQIRPMLTPTFSPGNEPLVNLAGSPYVSLPPGLTCVSPMSDAASVASYSRSYAPEGRKSSIPNLVPIHSTGFSCTVADHTQTQNQTQASAATEKSRRKSSPGCRNVKRKNSVSDLTMQEPIKGDSDDINNSTEDSNYPNQFTHVIERISGSYRAFLTVRNTRIRHDVGTFACTSDAVKALLNLENKVVSKRNSIKGSPSTATGGPQTQWISRKRVRNDCGDDAGENTHYLRQDHGNKLMKLGKLEIDSVQNNESRNA